MDFNLFPVIRKLLLPLILFAIPTHLFSAGSVVSYTNQYDTDHPEKQGASQRKYTTEIELRSDNDMYLLNMQDQYYTNGLFINIRKFFDASKLKPTESNRLMQFSLGHEMYNAFTAQIDSISAVDRPITAHLFLSASIRHFFEKEQLFGYSLSIGTIGKRAMGEPLQAGLHDLLNMYHAAGWEFQLNNAWGVNLSAEYLVLVGRTEKSWADFSFHSELNAGTLRTNLKAGPIIRIGDLNAYDRSAHFGSRLQSRERIPEREWYLYYKPEANLVFFDGTLQGGLFLKDKGPVTAQPERWLISNHFGGVYASGPVSFKVQYFFNTKESRQSLFRHQYGSLSFAYRF